MDRLGATRMTAAISGSMGGMQVLECAAVYPELVGGLAPLVIGARR